MSKIILTNVRLSFPSLFKRASFNGQEGKFEATFLLDKVKDVKQIEMLKIAIRDVLYEAKIKVASDKFCLKDGDNIDYDGYENTYAIKASSKEMPTLLDRDKTSLVEEDGKPYAGCYVNAIIDIWIQNNSYGKRVNANLYGIQFVRDGHSFGKSNITAVSLFDDLDALPDYMFDRFDVMDDNEF
tara:strand:- start:68 stop:619 length:552 start_codon:yes stop_codon:yes gene_type:complete